MVKIGIDLSLRSTAISVTENNKLIECFIHQPKEKVYEQLLINNFFFFSELLKNLTIKYDVEKINLEDLSLGSKSSVLDVIGANYWLIRCILHNLKIPYQVYSPANWRKIHEVIPKTKKNKEWKESLGKDYLKLLTLEKLDEETRNKIMKFCSDNKLKSKSEYDLADSFFISCC